MAKPEKKKVADSFRPHCKDGDKVRVWMNSGAIITITAKIDRDGDLNNADLCICAGGARYLQVLKEAPPPVGIVIEGVILQVIGGRLLARGEHVTDNLLAAIVFMSREYEIDFTQAMQDAWLARPCVMTPRGLRAGCVSLSHEGLSKALDWVMANY